MCKNHARKGVECCFHYSRYINFRAALCYLTRDVAQCIDVFLWVFVMRAFPPSLIYSRLKYLIKVPDPKFATRLRSEICKWIVESEKANCRARETVITLVFVHLNCSRHREQLEFSLLRYTVHIYPRRSTIAENKVNTLYVLVLVCRNASRHMLCNIWRRWNFEARQTS